MPRRAAAAVCLVEALVMAGFALFYVLEMVRGEGSDRMRVLTSAILIAVFAVAVGALARLWLGRSDWPVTPTIVWHVLLVPVAVAMAQSGQVLVAVLLGAAVVAGVATALAAARTAA